MKKSRKTFHKESDKLDGVVKVLSNLKEVDLYYSPQSLKFTNTMVINEALSPLVSRLLSEYSEKLKHSPNINSTKDTLEELIQKASAIRNSFTLLDASLGEEASTPKTTLTFTSSKGAKLETEFK
jgi:hypothetical protein